MGHSEPLPAAGRTRPRVLGGRSGAGEEVMTASSDPALGLNYRPTLPRRKDWRIGCVGAGFIMKDCHLVAYRNAGFNPVAIASRNAASAREAAQRHSVPKVHDTIDSLLA